MISKKLERLYNVLDAEERYELLLAAMGRSDEPEIRRLISVAPRLYFRVPDHYGLLEATYQVLTLQLLDLLDCAATLWFATANHSNRTHDKVSGQIVISANRFLVHLAAAREMWCNHGQNLEDLLNVMQDQLTLLHSTEKAARQILQSLNGPASRRGKAKALIPALASEDSISQIWEELFRAVARSWRGKVPLKERPRPDRDRRSNNSRRRAR